MITHVVEVRHPAAIVHVPARGRAERLSLAETVIPVGIPVLAPRDVEKVDRRSFLGGAEPGPFSCWRGARYVRHDGGLWRGLEGRNHKGNPQQVLAPDLFAYLTRDPAARLTLDDAFRGTPVVAWGLGQVQDVIEPMRPSPRGEPIDVEGSRTIRRDDRNRAGIAIARHLTRRIMLVGDEAYERIAPVAYLTDVGYSTHGQGGVAVQRRLAPGRTLHASPVSRDAAVTQRGFWVPEMYDAGARAWLALGIEAEIDALIPRAALDGLAGMTRLALDARIRSPEEGDDAQRIGELHTRVRDLEIDALTGVAEGEDPLPGLRTLAEALEAVVATRPWHHGQLNAAFTLCDLRDYYVPQAERAFAPAMDAEDVESLVRVTWT